MKKNKKVTGLIPQMEEASVKHYDKITVELLEEYLEDIMNAPVRRGQYDTTINVLQNESQLSFKIGTLRTGLGGFINYETTCKGFMMMSPIVFNGIRLDTKGREEFWKQYEQIKALYQKND